MFNDVLTYWQLFGIGLTFGFAGPCLFTCAPVLVVYITGKQLKWKQALVDIFIFLCGRLLAYSLLGYLAGLSGVLLRKFTGSNLSGILKITGGIVIVFLALQIWLGRELFAGECFCKAKRVLNCGSLILLGFIMGVFPCAPLLALLFEIALISKSGLTGLAHSLFFGLGTFVSGFIVIGILSGVFTFLPQKILRSRISNHLFRAVCALLLILLGLKLIF
ncbi:MAG: sulfite exporter TauE/SafE family protein [Candidatus Omnitrophota bacterium]|jgi:thiol:disulfide interchange protein DsbD